MVVDEIEKFKQVLDDYFTPISDDKLSRNELYEQLRRVKASAGCCARGVAAGAAQCADRSAHARGANARGVGGGAAQDSQSARP